MRIRWMRKITDKIKYYSEYVFRYHAAWGNYLPGKEGEFCKTAHIIGVFWFSFMIWLDREWKRPVVSKSDIDFGRLIIVNLIREKKLNK